LPFKLRRTEIAKRLVLALSIVKHLDVIKDSRPCRFARGEVAVVDEKHERSNTSCGDRDRRKRRAPPGMADREGRRQKEELNPETDRAKLAKRDWNSGVESRSTIHNPRVSGTTHHSRRSCSNDDWRLAALLFFPNELVQLTKMK
jgi:hypothetical protein